ncbi:MAG: family 10 glycosylhydrolase [Sumerlaeia bacterium]
MGQTGGLGRDTPGPPDLEWRGVWISRFEWTSGDGSAITQRLRDMMATLRSGNLNAVLFQVRGQGDTLYPSRTGEPWSEMISQAARTIDPVSVAVREAKAAGIEFHAWHNLSVIWQSASEQFPKDTSHPFYRFAHPKEPGRCRGVIYGPDRKPKFFGESGYTWLTPGNPEVTTYVRQQIAAFLDAYEVDGLHWDDRTGLPHGASLDPVSLERFQGRGNPERIQDLEAWQRDQLGRMLSDIRVVARARNPRLRISMSPFGIADKTRIPGYNRFSDAVRDFGVEPEKWLAMGLIDALMPQIYWDEADPAPNYSTLVRDWMRHNRTGRPIWPGSALKPWPGKQDLLGQQQVNIALTRALGLNGNTFWSYGAAKPEEWRALSRKAYTNVAKVPPLAEDGKGQIMGSVTLNGKPVMDGHVWLEGRDQVYLTGADGFFGIPAVEPGEVRLALDVPGVSRSITKVTVPVDKTAVVRWPLG